MAVIVQADPYQVLSRKIGYSVGLEKLLSRVTELVEVYVRDKSLSFVSFNDLVENSLRSSKARRPGRTPPAEHRANFYGTLNLVRLIGREVEPLYQLDSLSILWRLFPDEREKFIAASQVVLTQALVEADGDIFLNGLLAEFQPARMKALLESMQESKLRQLKSVFHTPQLYERISQIVAIKNQSERTSAKGPSSRSIAEGRFAKRDVPLASLRRQSALRRGNLGIDSISEDYVNKVSVSRKGWATDLGLFNDREKQRTTRGQALLDVLVERVLATNADQTAVMFWGYETELQKLRIEPKDLGARICEPWDLLGSIADAMAVENKLSSPPNGDETIEFLRGVFKMYKETNPARELIRNSLPLYVAEPVLAAWCVATGRRLPALRQILEREYKSKGARRVQQMIIRGTSGALFFMS